MRFCGISIADPVAELYLHAESFESLAELARQVADEALLPLDIQRFVGGLQLGGQPRAAHLAALGEQGVGQPGGQVCRHRGAAPAAAPQ